MAYFVGLDLGQDVDYTALAVIETAANNELHLRHLERYPLRTSYTTIAADMERLMADLHAKAPPRKPYPSGHAFRTKKPSVELLVDAGGVGRAVVDILRDQGLKFVGVSIHGGERVTGTSRGVNVPKKDIVAAILVPFQNETLMVAEGLELWPALREELLGFGRKQNPKTSHVYYEHHRSSDHDDLVLAAALACWGIARRERKARRVARAYSTGEPSPVVPRFPMGS